MVALENYPVECSGCYEPMIEALETYPMEGNEPMIEALETYPMKAAMTEALETYPVERNGCYD